MVAGVRTQLEPVVTTWNDLEPVPSGSNLFQRVGAQCPNPIGTSRNGLERLGTTLNDPQVVPILQWQVSEPNWNQS